MQCWICKFQPDTTSVTSLERCTACNTVVCFKCVCNNIAPDRCVLCMKPSHWTRSATQETPEEAVALISELTTFSESKGDKKAASFERILKYLKPLVPWLCGIKRGHSKARCIILYKMEEAMMSSSSWLTARLDLRVEAARIFELLKWHHITLDVGKPYTTVPFDQATGKAVKTL